jgi:DNA-binding beta-propeller fold protein YncE
MRARIPIVAFLTLLVLGLSAGSAAAETHPFAEKLTGTGGNRRPQNPFEDPCGVAVDGNGDIYVSDYYHDLIDIFTLSEGKSEYITSIPDIKPGNGPCGLAVDSSGSVYVNTWREGVLKLSPSSYPPTLTTTYTSTVIDESQSATGVALDPVSGDVYVDDGTYIAKRSPSGTLIEKIGEGSLGEGYGMAVSGFGATLGYLYAADAQSDTVKVYNPAVDTVNPVAEFDGSGSPQGGFSYLVDAAVAVDSSDGHLFVVDNLQHDVKEHPEAAVDEFNPAGEYRSQISHWIVLEGEPPIPVEYHLVSGEPSGLTVSGGKVYVTNGNEEETVVDVFGPTAAGRRLSVSKAGAGGGTVTSRPAGINCGTACAAEYDTGEVVQLTATPDAHSTFSGWSGGGCSGTGSCFVTMSEAKSVTATFAAIPQQNLTLTVTGSGEGTVASAPEGIECSVGNVGNCAEHFNENSTATLIAAPAPHSRLVGWSGCGSQPTPLECKVTMSAAKAVTATFEAIPQLPLEVSLSGPGSVTSSPAGISCGEICEEEFDEGSTVTLTAAPAPHNQVAWQGCSAVPDPDHCEVAMSQAEAVSASFTPILHRLSVATSGGGTVSADHGPISNCGGGGSCSGTYQDGEVIVLTASSGSGYLFVGFSGACGGTAPCHLTLEGDAAVTANFAALPPVPIPAAIKLGKLAVKGASATVPVTVSGPGAIKVSGGRAISPETIPVTKGGTVTVRFALGPKGLKALRHSRSGRLKAPAAFTFTPAEGGPAAVASQVVTFMGKAGPHRRHRRHHP